MPRIDKWGLLPKGHTGPRDNPFLVAPRTEGPEVEASGAVVVELAGVHAPQQSIPAAPVGDGDALPQGVPTTPSAGGITPSSSRSTSSLRTPRKRGMYGSYSGSAWRALKRRKWIAVDE